MFVDDERAMPFTRELCRKLADRGWLTMAWPAEYGGQGASVVDADRRARRDVGARGAARPAVHEPQLHRSAHHAVRHTGPAASEFLPPMARGEAICGRSCSPSPTRAPTSRRCDHARDDDGDHFVVNGQKIWSSYADAPADWGLLLARTDPDVRRSTPGSACSSLDMTTPGRHGAPDSDNGRAARVQRGVLRRRRRATRTAARRAGRRLGRDHRRAHVRTGRASRGTPRAAARARARRRTRERSGSRRTTRTCAGCSPTSAPASRRRACSTTARSRCRRAARCRRSRRRSRACTTRTVEQLTGNVVMEVLGAAGAAARRRSRRAARRRGCSALAAQHSHDRGGRHARDPEEHRRPAGPRAPPAELIAAMDLFPTDEQALLTETARSFVTRSADTQSVRTIEASEVGFDPAQWAAMVELGWTELEPLELALVADELGRGAVPSPLLVSAALRNALPELAGAHGIGDGSHARRSRRGRRQRVRGVRPRSVRERRAPDRHCNRLRADAARPNGFDVHRRAASR